MVGCLSSAVLAFSFFFAGFALIWLLFAEDGFESDEMASYSRLIAKLVTFLEGDMPLDLKSVLPSSVLASSLRSSVCSVLKGSWLSILCSGSVSSTSAPFFEKNLEIEMFLSAFIWICQTWDDAK